MQLLGGLPKKLSTPWQDTRCLVFLFCLWKAVLFVVIALAPGPGYDTSSTLLNDANSWNISSATFGETATSAPFPLKNVRWDAIYFLQIARRKYVFEQEWAFGPGFPSLVSFVKQGIYYQTRQLAPLKSDSPIERQCTRPGFFYWRTWRLSVYHLSSSVCAFTLQSEHHHSLPSSTQQVIPPCCGCGLTHFQPSRSIPPISLPRISVFLTPLPGLPALCLWATT